MANVRTMAHSRVRRQEARPPGAKATPAGCMSFVFRQRHTIYYQTLTRMSQGDDLSLAGIQPALGLPLSRFADYKRLIDDSIIELSPVRT